MKVGVFFPYFDPSSGGGYTFEQEILQALLALCSESPHEFILYFDVAMLKNMQDFSLPEKMQIKVLDPLVYFSAIKWVLSRAMHKLGFKKWGISYQDILQTALGRDEIQLVWFATCLYQPVDIPYIATVWDIQHRLQPWFPEVSQNGEWDKREKSYLHFLQRATYIITPNQAGQDELLLFYQIPPMCFRQLAHPTPRVDRLPSQEEVTSVLKKYGIFNKYIFYPAQFWAHKNHVNLLKALNLLRNVYQMDMDLVLAGSDQGNLYFVRTIVEDLRLKENVHFVNFVPREDLIALYTGAFALTYVTYFGPENLPPLESFACGCPVIASDVAGTAEQLGDAALRVNASRPEEIALAVKKLHDDEQLRLELIGKGFSRANQFTSLDYVRGVFAMLDDFESIRSNWR